MKRLLVIILGLFSVAYGQYSPTGAKTQFKNGIGLGSKDSSAFAANDSLALTIDRNNRLLWRNNGASGTWNVVARNNDTSYLANFVRLQTGNLFRQDGKIWVSDTIYSSGVVRAGSHIRTDSIQGTSIIRFSGTLVTPNSQGFGSRNTSGVNITLLGMTPQDTGIVGSLVVPTVLRSVDIARFQNFTSGARQEMPNKSGVVALTSDIADSSSALRASINTKLNISDTAAMKATITLDRVLQAGNLTGRGFTAGASNFNGLLRGYEKAFFTTSATGVTDTVLSVRSAASAPAFVVQNSNGQAINAQAATGTGVLSTVTGSSGSALDLVASGGGRLISAIGNGSTAMLLSNGGRLQVRDSIVISTNNRSLWGQGNIGGVFQLIGTNTSDQINIASGGNQVNIGAKTVVSDSIVANGARFTAGVIFNATINGTSGSFSGNSTQVELNTATRAINVIGKDNLYAVSINGGATTGQSFGQLVSAGTNSSDVSFSVFDKAEVNNYLQVRGDGNIYALPTYSVTVGGTNRDLFIDNTGLIGYVSSFRASKKNIQPLNSTSWLHQLNPVKFNYRVKDSLGRYTDSAYNELEYGLIAEEVEPINKEMVFYDVDSTGKHLRGVHYSKLIIPLLKEIQDQKKTITALEARLARLEELLKIKP